MTLRSLACHSLLLCSPVPNRLWTSSSPWPGVANSCNQKYCEPFFFQAPTFIYPEVCVCVCVCVCVYIYAYTSYIFRHRHIICSVGFLSCLFLFGRKFKCNTRNETSLYNIVWKTIIKIRERKECHLNIVSNIAKTNTAYMDVVHYLVSTHCSIVICSVF